jgi:hypothetical protein
MLMISRESVGNVSVSAGMLLRYAYTNRSYTFMRHHGIAKVFSFEANIGTSSSSLCREA